MARYLADGAGRGLPVRADDEPAAASADPVPVEREGVAYYEAAGLTRFLKAPGWAAQRLEAHLPVMLGRVEHARHARDGAQEPRHLVEPRRVEVRDAAHLVTQVQVTELRTAGFFNPH